MILLEDQLSKEPAQYTTKNEAIKIIEQLEIELRQSTIPGIGLAAPQIGINKAVAIIRVKNPYDPTNPVICVNLINPVLINANDFTLFDEGCLSFPGKSSKTVRYNNIIVETLSDYDYYAEFINAKRYNRKVREIPLLSDDKILLNFGEVDSQDALGRLICVAVQHEFSHLLGLTMFDFKPKEIGRNELCPCNSNKKNKKCCAIKLYNSDLQKLYKPNYKS